MTRPTIAVLAALFAVAACHEGPQLGHVSVRLTDAPNPGIGGVRQTDTDVTELRPFVASSHGEERGEDGDGGTRHGFLDPPLRVARRWGLGVAVRPCATPAA